MTKKFLYAALFCLLGINAFLFFYGNPVERSESHNIVQDYVKEKYPQESFIVTEVNHYPGEGTFVVHVKSRSGKLSGNIDVKKGKVVKDERSKP
ncbi:YfjL-like protein [Bacillus sp. T33-2]|uniref:YfjL-like protein n=1 Tax=Bacillus sp. T33-2 TaxID=2054168 RepID=UPI000C76DD09|nr:hypothetical protein [Bacillus sp. T33-2]PLR99891.1 hypothetical protein CVD19_02210 [Bacillus sp. T33-2]